MAISPESTRYTAFNTPFGSYKFLRLIYILLSNGMRQSPNSFQLLMDKVLQGLTFESVLCYLDDICIMSETFESHMSKLHEVLSRHESAGLKLGPSKCKLAYSRCIFLGHEISKEGIRPPAAKLEIIQNYPVPKNQKELKCTLGLFNWSENSSKIIVQ